ncbi:hypothetical protein LZ009_09555 [Ramlibacter sp. XY19]|uniref:hypothetical protein n=1 Tax=Ramlibacter paludis TaxID=2908000 RepID=UPI0023DC1B0B|nr:hypothetical protein [Ramlibacter paludis]MCG2593026.1 hypothetical protein [Ramlibacter paludis]
MSVYAIGMTFTKGVPQPGQRPFWRVCFHAVDAGGKSVQLFDDFDEVAHWVHIEGAGVCRLEHLATKELMELPDAWWTLLEHYLVAGSELRTALRKSN